MSAFLLVTKQGKVPPSHTLKWCYHNWTVCPGLRRVFMTSFLCWTSQASTSQSSTKERQEQNKEKKAFNKKINKYYNESLGNFLMNLLNVSFILMPSQFVHQSNWTVCILSCQINAAGTISKVLYMYLTRRYISSLFDFSSTKRTSWCLLNGPAPGHWLAQ